jgi:Uma2 family endonuclease
MIASGILPEGEPYELVDGLLVRKDRSAAGDDPMTVGHGHSLAVKQLAALGPKLSRLGCHIQTQQPITLPPHDEPEPDAAIVIGKPTDYRSGHPGPNDVTCVIEVADASLRRDRTAKLRMYAAAGIARYIIINLADATVSVYTGPLSKPGEYAQSETLRPGDVVDFPVPGKKVLKVPVRKLLP